MTGIPENFSKSICAAAHEYIENGWSVFPLSISDKRPIGKWKRFQTEYVLPDEIDDWEENGAVRQTEDGEIVGTDKMFNLALVTGAISGIIVLDCDNEKAIEFAKSKGLTSPVGVKTSRGMHYYFRHPNNGREFRNKAGSNPGSSWYAVPGLDLRGDGGYVVCPPSISLDVNGNVKHEYVWSFAPNCDLDDMPEWTGQADDILHTEGFDFAALSLEDVRVGDSIMDVREQVKKRVEFNGEKLAGPDMGNGTDAWMIKFCGQMVRRGVVGKELWDAIVQFHSEYFTYHGSAANLERWLKTKMRSAMEMDFRNYPQDYDPQTRERLVKKVDPDEEQAKPFTPIYSKDFKRLLTSLGDVVYHVDPIVPSRSIIQVVGYNGHGKSFFVGSMATALAANKPQFGPFFINKPSKVFYLDFDNPARTVLNRFSGFEAMHGDPGANLPIWSPAIIPAEMGGNMNLRDADGLKVFEKWMDEIRPDVVVIDTVRNAFGGLDEKNPQEWFHVNRVAKVIRDKYQASVILVHHRNKPNEQGLGREAGSTAQLTDLDTQIIITQVYEDKNIARTKAGLFNDELIYERNGSVHSPFSYLRQKLANNGMQNSHRLRMVTEVSFGKVREQTDLHRTYYLGWTEEINTGNQDMLWTPSPREDAIALAATGKSPNEIAQALYIPVAEVKKWLGV